jgi:anti-anti-sigma factor
MDIIVSGEGEIKTLNFNGHLDTNTSPDAEAKLNELINAGEKKILIDFEKLDYISSAGLRILLGTAKQLKASGGELRICNLNETVSEVFEISGFNSILKVFVNNSDALQEF